MLTWFRLLKLCADFTYLFKDSFFLLIVQHTITAQFNKSFLLPTTSKLIIPLLGWPPAARAALPLPRLPLFYTAPARYHVSGLPSKGWARAR
jgi:hypothetical protein